MFAEGCNSSVKRENVLTKVVCLKKARKHRSNSKPRDSEMSADVSVKQPKKRLAGCWIKDDVSKTRRARPERETPVHKSLSVDLTFGHFLCCWRNPFDSKANIGIKFEYLISRFAVITAI